MSDPLKSDNERRFLTSISDHAMGGMLFLITTTGTLLIAFALGIGQDIHPWILLVVSVLLVIPIYFLLKWIDRHLILWYDRQTHEARRTLRAWGRLIGGAFFVVGIVFLLHQFG